MDCLPSTFQPFRLRESPYDELQSITLPDTTTQALGPAARNASDRVTAGSESVCRVTESVRDFYQLEYLHKAFTLDLIESVPTHFH